MVFSGCLIQFSIVNAHPPPRDKSCSDESRPRGPHPIGHGLDQSLFVCF